jgi:hypothetical protein
MIISASRRTDIPAFYSQWFFNRLKEGFVMVRNPMNPQSVSRIDLNPELIDCIVFWTRNPNPLVTRLDELAGYHYYFLFTITPYGENLEKNLPSKDQVIDCFIDLSRRIGKERVIWRYDPILLNKEIDAAYHCRQFEYIAGRIGSYTEKCITSFIDMYKKCERNLKGFNIKELNAEEMTGLIEALSPIAREKGIEIVTCAEEMDFSGPGCGHGKCIDDELISRICGYPLTAAKDSHQRKTCRCIESIDIGAYNTCDHGCLYCYANSDVASVRRNKALHDPESPLLIGKLSGDEKIVERKIESFRKKQRELF